MLDGGEIAAAVAETGHRLQPLDIVLVNTAAAYSRPDYSSRGRGIGREATLSWHRP